MVVLLFLGCWSGLVLAKQSGFQVNQSEHRWHFEYQWSDKDKKTHQTKFVLNRSSIAADLERSLNLSKQELSQFEANAVNEWAKYYSSVTVKAHVEGGGVRVSVEGINQDELKKALQRSDYIRKQAREEYLDKVGYKEYTTGIAPDYVRFIQEYSPELSPLAHALGSGGDFRIFLRNVLAFIQNIPYESVSDFSYRRPLSLLAKNTGDCDSKVVLFLALIHNAYPNIPLAVLDVPGHAAAMIGVPPKGKEKAYRINDQIWVPAEPVGPGLLPLGKLDSTTLQKLTSGQYSLRQLSKAP